MNNWQKVVRLFCKYNFYFCVFIFGQEEDDEDLVMVELIEKNLVYKKIKFLENDNDVVFCNFKE